MILAGTLAAFLCLHSNTLAPDPSAVDDILRRARNEYAYGDYQDAVTHLRELLYPMQLFNDAQVLEARYYLALSYYLTDQKAAATEEFAKLLYLDPDYQLDPFSVAPAVVEVFEKLRQKLQAELDVIRQRKSDAKLQKPTVGMRRVIETTIVEKSDFATLLPFGVGQFQNGDTGYGLAFALTEVILLGANIGMYALCTSMSPYPADKRVLVQALTAGQYASAALFGIVWTLGVFHARLHFVPRLVTPPVVRDEPYSQTLAPVPNAAPPGVVMTINF